VDLTELATALAEIEQAAQSFVEVPQSAATDDHLLQTLRRGSEKLNEPYGFDPGTEALRSRVWKDCVTIISNLELKPAHSASQQSDLVKTQVQKLSTLVGGLIDLVRQLAEKA